MSFINFFICHQCKGIFNHDKEIEKDADKIPHRESFEVMRGFSTKSIGNRMVQDYYYVIVCSKCMDKIVALNA